MEMWLDGLALTPARPPAMWQPTQLRGVPLKMPEIWHDSQLTCLCWPERGKPVLTWSYLDRVWRSLATLDPVCANAAKTPPANRQASSHCNARIMARVLRSFEFFVFIATSSHSSTRFIFWPLYKAQADYLVCQPTRGILGQS